MPSSATRSSRGLRTCTASLAVCTSRPSHAGVAHAGCMGMLCRRHVSRCVQLPGLGNDCHATRRCIACSTVQCCTGGSPRLSQMAHATAFMQSTEQTCCLWPHLELPAAHIHETDAAGAGGGRQAGVGAQRGHLRDAAASGLISWTGATASGARVAAMRMVSHHSWVRAAKQQATATSWVLSSRMRRLRGRRPGCCCPGEPPPPCR